MNALTITPTIDGALVTAADAAKLRRDELIKQAASVTTITDRLDADDATATLKQLTEFSKAIEAQREEAQAPVLALQRKIQALAKELTEAVQIEAKRIGRGLGEFEAGERAKAENERYKAQLEVQRIAEEARKKAIEVSKSTASPLAQARAVDAVVEQAAAAVAVVQQQAAAFVPPKVAGAKLRGTICFEVTDINLLHAENPTLCIVEPNGTAIRAILKQNPNLKVPGLRHWIEQKLSV